jgi:hypothetical protein
MWQQQYLSTIIHPSNSLEWASTSALQSSGDVKIVRNATGQLDVRGDSGLRVRNLANSADAPITAGTGTFSGIVSINPVNGGTLVLHDGLGTPVKIVGGNSGYSLAFYNRYNLYTPVVEFTQSQMRLGASTSGILFGLGFAANIQSAAPLDNAGGNSLNAGTTTTHVLNFLGTYGGAYPEASGRTNGRGFNFVAGNGATPTDTNGNGGVGGDMIIRLGVGGAGAGTGIKGTDGQFLVRSTDGTEYFRIHENTASFSSKVITAASTTSIASINIPDGVAPTTPADGDIWCVGDVLYRRIGGVTKSLTFV